MQLLKEITDDFIIIHNRSTEFYEEYQCQIIQIFLLCLIFRKVSDYKWIFAHTNC